MVLKQIISRNLQNHSEVVIDLPPTGLIVFTGQNSNGKSVIVKTTRTLLNGDLRKPLKRAALVNRKATFGEIIYVRDDNVRLTAHIAREASQTYIKLEIPEEEPVVRYLADKSYMELIRRFGWHYDVDSGISLNIAEEEDALLFYKTSNKCTGSIIETATSDTSANKVAETFEATIKETRSFRASSISQVTTYSNALRELVVEDTQPLLTKKDELEVLLHDLKQFYFPVLPEIKFVPKVTFIEIYIPKLPTVRFPELVDCSCKLPDISGILKEMQLLKENTCPTCGRHFDV